jgi:hypothetical protein
MDVATPFWLYVLFFAPPILLLIMILRDWMQGYMNGHHPLDTQSHPRRSQKRAS